MASGVVEKANERSPTSAVGKMDAEAVDATTKSVARQLVDPSASAAEMVHEMGTPARC